MSNAAGEDRSSFQQVTSWGGNAFAFSKATEGTGWTDSTFAANWAAARKAGKVRGAYHFFHPAEDPEDQAEFFYRTVAAHGIVAGDVLACDAEILVGAHGVEDYGTDRAALRAHEGLKAVAPHLGAVDVGTAALRFLDRVKALAGPQCRVLLYTDLSMATGQLHGCTAYPLWLAYYAPAPPKSVAPWKSWTFWQNGARGAGGGDLDYFNGDAVALRRWAHPVTPLPPDWVYPPVRNLAARAGDTSVFLEWDAPAQPAGEAPLPGIGWYEIAVTEGPELKGRQLEKYPRWVRKGPSPMKWQGGSIPPRVECTAGVRATDENRQHAGEWATVTFTAG
jgi:GH25 family lysozyme M1 (1,4-beta-N-acetylmuramidase)